MPIDQNRLAGAGALRYVDRDFEVTLKNRRDRKGGNRIFLSHSSKDRLLAEGLEYILVKELGLSVYVDWNDPRLPETPDAETARILQEAIRSSDFFLFLATENSVVSSSWCPWEIGYADADGTCRIVVAPTESQLGVFWERVPPALS